MSALVEPFRTEWLEKRLKVSHQTVARWRHDKKVRAESIEDMLKVLRELGSGHAKEAAPDVPERLERIERLVRAIAEKTGVDTGLIEEMYAELHGGLPPPPQHAAARRTAGPRPPDE